MRLASHARLDTEAFYHLCRRQNSLHVSQVQSSHYRCLDRATKIKTTKFNSGSLFQLFTKISTHENNPLYGKVIPALSFVLITATDPNPQSKSSSLSPSHRVNFLRRSHRIVTNSKGGHGVTVKFRHSNMRPHFVVDMNIDRY